MCFVFLSFRLSVCLSIYLSIFLSVRLFNLSVCLFCLSIYLSVCLFCLSVYLFVCFVCLSVLCVCLSVFACLSVCLSVILCSRLQARPFDQCFPTFAWGALFNGDRHTVSIFFIGVPKRTLWFSKTFLIKTSENLFFLSVREWRGERLTLLDIHRWDSGSFFCIATNNVLSVSKRITLSVNCEEGSGKGATTWHNCPHHWWCCCCCCWHSCCSSCCCYCCHFIIVVTYCKLHLLVLSLLFYVS